MLFYPNVLVNIKTTIYGRWLVVDSCQLSRHGVARQVAQKIAQCKSAFKGLLNVPINTLTPSGHLQILLSLTADDALPPPTHSGLKGLRDPILNDTNKKKMIALFIFGLVSSQ